MTPPPPPPGRYGFPKRNRVTSGGDFTRTLHRGGCAADGVLVVFAMQRVAGPRTDASVRSRLGVTIPKKTGSAPVRNHWKRLIREAYRTQPDAFAEGYDFIVRPKKGAMPQWRAIQKGLPQLARKAVARCERAKPRPR